MGYKIISGYYAGYTLAPQYSEVKITYTGGIGGAGLSSDHFTLVYNFGYITPTNGSTGVSLAHGGTISNESTGLITGATAVSSQSDLALFNFGTIRSGGVAIQAAGYDRVVNEAGTASSGAIIGNVSLASGFLGNDGIVLGSVFIANYGFVENGSTAISSARIIGDGGVYIAGGPGQTSEVNNYGEIAAIGAGPGHNGVNIGGPLGDLLNLTASAYVSGDTGVLISGKALVGNEGTIAGLGTLSGACGVALAGYGTITNGAQHTDTAAIIEGYAAVKVAGQGVVTNWGTIESRGQQLGLDLGGGGTVTNGGRGGADPALIEGYGGVKISGQAGTVTNFGRILGGGGYGVTLSAGGTVLNEAAGATISGSVGVGVASGTVVNLGVVQGSTVAGGRGVYLYGGRLTNGSAADTGASIGGYTGLVMLGPSSATNFGVISGGNGAGVAMNTSLLVNGSAKDSKAVIFGAMGVYGGYARDTVVNFGAIYGAGGTALRFTSATDTLEVEAGCAFIGAVQGGGGVLDLASGVGTLSGLFAASGVTVTGSMAKTTFTGFKTITIAHGASFADAKPSGVAAGDTLTVAGTLTLSASGALNNLGLIETQGGALTISAALNNGGTLAELGGTLLVSGAVTGRGSAQIDGGRLRLGSSFSEAVAFTGTTGTLELAQSQGFAATVTGFATAGGTAFDLLDIGFGKATKASFSGDSAGGVLTVTDAAHTAHIKLKGDYLGSAFTTASDGHGGTLVRDPPAAAGAPPAAVQALAGLMAALGAKQAVTMELGRCDGAAEPRFWAANTRPCAP